MRYYLNLDEAGYVTSFYTVDGYDGEIEGHVSVDSVEGIDTYHLSAYRWDGEKLVLDGDKLAALMEEAAAQERASCIAELKAKLTATDYVVIKIAEGAAPAEEYADVIAQRQAWREKINELEAVK